MMSFWNGTNCLLFKNNLSIFKNNFKLIFFWFTDDSAESLKWQQHLKLLREQYLHLQAAHADLQQKYALATANEQKSGFIGRLLSTVASLHKQNQCR